jgi:hypothetical protein
MEHHEIIDFFIGNVSQHSVAFDLSMQPDIDGGWISVEAVELAILSAVYKYDLEEVIEGYLK